MLKNYNTTTVRNYKNSTGYKKPDAGAGKAEYDLWHGQMYLCVNKIHL